MQLITIADIAKQTNLSQSTARFYRDKYNDYFFYVGEGRARRYLAESIEVMEIIVDGYKQKQPSAMIESRLQQRFGIPEQKTTESKQQQTATANIVSMTELDIQKTIAFTIRQEMTAIREELIDVKEQLALTQNGLNNHYRLVDERLRQSTKRKSFWQRLFE